MTEHTSGMDCALHPDMALCVIMDTDGEMHIHRHISEGETAAVLADLVDQIRADLVANAGARDADLP